MTQHTHQRFGPAAGAILLAVAAFLTSAEAFAQSSVSLVAAPFTKQVKLPDGTTAAVPMWGFGLDPGSCTIADPSILSVPGPRITVPSGQTTLDVNLRNCLPEPVSIVIPGQQPSNAPVRNAAGRVVSIAPEAAANGGNATYSFANLKPGTFLYQSGSHAAVQVQMGLYGAMTANLSDAATGTPAQAYAGAAYSNEALLLFSEIDPELHQAVASGNYGEGKAVTSTIDYSPTIFLINGESYTSGAPMLPGGFASQLTLLRLLNAGLDSHVVVLAPPSREPGANTLNDTSTVRLVAEDGNPYADVRARASVFLPAGKTQDALWLPFATGDYAVYDRALRLEAAGQANGGMLARLQVGAATTSDLTASDVPAVPDLVPGSEDAPVTFNVLINDVDLSGTAAPPTSASVYASPLGGTLVPGAAGSFTYTPAPNFSGVDGFWYKAIRGGASSAPTLVTISVAPVQDAPTALPVSIGLTAGGAKPVTLTGTDPDGDRLTFRVTGLPTHGTLSIVDPVSSAKRDLASSDLYVSSGAQGTVIPADTVVYTPTAGATPYVGADTFQFVATDGAAGALGLVSNPAASVGVTVDAAPTAAAAGSPLTLTVLGVDAKSPGSTQSIGAYRWTLEEDLTYDVKPGTLDPNTLSVSFHRSYMPVVQSGDETSQPKVQDGKRYFVSVLPKADAGGYSNGGTPFAVTAGVVPAVTVYVDKLPLPTAQVRVRVFRDNSPLNGQYDTDESPLAGFNVSLDDAGGRYGMSGGQMMQDAFGNPLGTIYEPCTAAPCDSYQVKARGNGFLLTDAQGFATFENLRPGKYTAKIIPPGGQGWQQTSTIEGTKGIDAWVKANEPTFFSEFGPAGPHVEVGFTQPANDTTVLGAGAGPFSSVSGSVTTMHMSRPPDYRMFSGAPYDYTRPWVALNQGTTGGLIYAQPAAEDGSFTIPNVPGGSYTLTIFDSALDVIIASKAITVVGGTNQALGEVPVFPWFTRLYHHVFEDKNGNGLRDASEPGISDAAINTRWRDGSVYQSSATDGSGFVPFEETFPFFAWQVAEVDYSRFRATGVTVVVDDGGNVTTNTSWPTQVGIPDTDSRVLAPQPQSENAGAAYRTETGPVLLQGFQGFIGQTNVFLWGKAPYDAPGTGVNAPDVNYAPFDQFPAGNDVDANANGKFDVDRFNGGVTGIVHYSTTRAEGNARWGTAEPWEPGIPGVKVQLWDATRTTLLNEVQTDSWDESQPTGCQGTPFVYQGATKDCYDGLRNFNQVRPSVFDGGYAFYTALEPTSLPIEQRTAMRPLPAGKYVVKVIPPTGYQLVKEQDKNVDFGDEYVPAQFYLGGYPLGAAGGASDAPPAEAAVEDPLWAPFCVGDLQTVPAELSLFPGVLSAYGGAQMPTCDEKLVSLRNGQNGAANFFLFTEAPIAGHIIGFVLDDLANEFDQNSPQFGEKYAPPFLPISIRDWTGREISHTYTDRYGVYNALVPSTYTASTAIPSGMTPSMLTACINSPLTGTGPGGALAPDPFYNKQYTQFCYTLQYMPGTTTYLDTPVLPVGAFTGPGQATLDAELPSQTPVIRSVTGPANNGVTPVVPANAGPYVVPLASSAASRTITITSMGSTQVPNPAYDPTTIGESACAPANFSASCKTIARDYGFGANKGRVFVGNTQLSDATVNWSDSTITAEVPAGTPTGQLRVVRCLDAGCTSTRSSIVGVTLTVATPEFHAGHAPAYVSAGQSIQAAVDTAPNGGLVLVGPGTFEELVVMDKPVRLQGFGAPSTIINAVKTPAEKLQAWRDRVAATLSAPANADYLLPYQVGAIAAGFDLVGELLGPVLGGEGAAVTVLARGIPGTGGAYCPQDARPLAPAAFGLQRENSTSAPRTGELQPNARIDGFGLTGSDQAAGIEVNAYACNLQISNNRIYSNTGDFAGGVKVGHPGEVVELADEDAHNEYVSIANNHVDQNGSLTDTGGGGIAIGAGAANYSVKGNFVAGNFTSGFGAGISQIGRSSGGTIEANTVVFNESFSQSITTSGGGLFVGGRAPAAGAATPGSGSVVVTSNLVQGNAASGGDGGGIALSDLLNSDRVDLFGNTIINNVAGLAGGGISLERAPGVRIIHNTIARNDSLATAGAAFTPRATVTDPFISATQPAGIASRGANNPQIANSILWQNRSFCYGPVPNGTGVPYTNGPTYGLIPRGTAPCGTGSEYWDLGVIGSGTLSPTYSVMTVPSGATNTGTAPGFVANYFNGDRKQTIVAPELTTSIQAPAAFDEGGNFIRPMYGPLTLNRLDTGGLYGDYHVSAPQAGQELFADQLTGGTPLFGTTSATVPQGLWFDADRDSRTTVGIAPTRGADQPPVPTLTVSDASLVEGNSGTSNMTFTIALSKAVSSSISVSVATSNGTGATGAIGGTAACTPGLAACDYVTLPATALTFAPGETVKTVLVGIKGDTIYELNQVFNLNLTLVTTGTNVVVGDNVGVGTIVNDDAIPTVTFSSASIQEPASGNTSLVFPVTLTGAHEPPAVFTFSTANGTATGGANANSPGADYRAVTGSQVVFGATLLPTQSSNSLSVAIFADTRLESSETFYVNAASPSNLTLLTAQATGTIINR